MQRLSLRLTDPKVSQEYLDKKSFEVRTVSTLGFLFGLLLTVGAMIAEQYVNTRQFSTHLWIIRLCALLVHLIFLRVNNSFRVKLCQFHGPTIILLQLAHLLWINDSEIEVAEYLNDRNNLVQSLFGVVLVQILGILCNANWIFTTIALLITTSAAIFYCCYYYSFKDPLTFLLLSLIFFTLIYSMYVKERSEKSMIIQVAQSQQQNEDLQNILLNVP
jgi:hypothetical protein